MHIFFYLLSNDFSIFNDKQYFSMSLISKLKQEHKDLKVLPEVITYRPASWANRHLDIISYVLKCVK